LRNYSSFYLSRTGQTSNPIHHLLIWQSSVFLINSRYLLFYDSSIKFINKTINAQLQGPPLSRSYRVILPSSFNIFISSALVCSTSLPVSDLVRFYISKLFPDTYNDMSLRICFFMIIYDNTHRPTLSHFI